MVVVALVAPVVAEGQSARPSRTALGPQPLEKALQEVARRYGLELLFSKELVAQGYAAPVADHLTPEQALAAVLTGTGLVARRTATGSFVIVSARPAVEPEPVAVPEILVVGRRTQNADIRRYASDVQPYQVITREALRAAHASTLDEAIGKRITAASAGLSSAQQPLSGRGSAQSLIDLRGLGESETLILVDGRRLPRQMTLGLATMQPDINGLPQEAVERVEAITSTAGGIYGPGATGGVINVVLRRDYRGVEVSATSGISERGDSALRRVYVRAGFTPDNGATEVMASYSRATIVGLRLADRDFEDRARKLVDANAAPYHYTQLPPSNSLNIISTNLQSLQLKPEFGGALLKSNMTFLSQDARSTAATGQALVANAGALDLSLPAGAGGVGRSLTADTRTSSLLASLRHRFGSGIELYGEYLRLTNQGFVTYEDTFTAIEMPASDPRNPFSQTIGVNIPLPADLNHRASVRTTTERASAGVVLNLFADWKANLDFSVGRARRDQTIVGSAYSIDGYVALETGVPRPGLPALNPFGDRTSYHAAFMSYVVAADSSSRQVNRFTDFSARLAGSLLSLPAGPVTATILLEQRREHVLPATYYSREAFGLLTRYALAETIERVRSGSLEVRVPVLPVSSPLVPFRGMELQFAVRTDATSVSIPSAPEEDVVPGFGRFRSAARAATLFTAGAKARPTRGVILRASIATGETTPPLDAIGSVRLIGEDGPDPLRGNSLIPPYDLFVFGKITPERAQSMSVGTILTPYGERGPSLSLDYTRIRRSREVLGTYTGLVYYFLRNESLYPNRVIRAPLTDEDAARGYTGGRILRIDASYLNVGWTRIDAVDARIEMPLRMGGIGDLTARGSVSWQPLFRRFVVPNAAPIDFVSRADGTLRWRANGGLDWDRRSWGLALNAQYYGSYRVIYGLVGNFDSRVIQEQGRSRIGGELNIDLSARYTFNLSNRRKVDMRLGIQNLFDRNPAVVVAAEGSYSYYSDPRRRRFDFNITTSL